MSTALELVKPLRFKADQKMVEQLEQLLEMAKSGELVGLAVAYEAYNPRRGHYTGWCGRCVKGTLRTALLGALVCLKRELIEDIIK